MCCLCGSQSLIYGTNIGLVDVVNLGGGIGIANPVGLQTTVALKSLVGGTAITITDTATEITINATLPLATTSVNGIVRIATAYTEADTNGDGSYNVIIPSQIQNLIHGSTLKAVPDAADEILLADSTSGFTYKKTTIADLLANTATIGYFMDGADGDVTIGGTVTLTRDMFYHNLIVNGTLITNGYKVYGTGTISGAGTISANGNNGTSGSGATPGVGGAAINQGTLMANLGGTSGGAGGIGGGGVGQNGGVGTSISLSYTNITGSTGGTGGVSDSGTLGGNGGVIGSVTRGPRYNVMWTLAQFFGLVANPASMSFTNVLYQGPGNSTGGGGGGSQNLGGGTGGGGGGGGGNAGVIRIAFNIRNFTGIFHAVGGNGGNGGNASGSSNGGGGGGSGGQGGVVYTIGHTYTSLGTNVLTGGGFGSGGAGGSTGGAVGNNGVAGANGVAVQITV